MTWLKPVTELLLKILNLTDPKTREWVRKRKALDWAERYIFCNEAIAFLEMKREPSKKEERKLRDLRRKLDYYRKWFFTNN